MPNSDALLDAFEDYLRKARMIRAWKGIEGGGGHRDKYRVELLGGVFALAKLTNQDDGARQIRAEVAAWMIGRAIGCAHLLGATVLRKLELPEHGDVEASVQVFWLRNEPAPPIDTLNPMDVLRAAVFDYVIQMEDRGGSNYLGTGPPDEPPEDGRWHLKLFDHGNALRPGGSCQSLFVQLKAGSRLSDEIVSGLGRVTRGKNLAELVKLVGADVADDVATRAKGLLAGRLVP